MIACGIVNPAMIEGMAAVSFHEDFACMDFLAHADSGRDSPAIDADDGPQGKALANLQPGSPSPTSPPTGRSSNGSSRPEKWSVLLDRFYQILPFGTGGRRGAVGIGPNRMNLWTLGASVQGHCEYLKERFPGVDPLHVVLAYDVRQFEDQRKQSTTRDLPNPVLHLSSREFCPARRRRLRRQRHPRRTSCRRTASATWPRRSCRSPSAT